MDCELHTMAGVETRCRVTGMHPLSVSLPYGLISYETQLIGLTGAVQLFSRGLSWSLVCTIKTLATSLPRSSNVISTDIRTLSICIS